MKHHRWALLLSFQFHGLVLVLLFPSSAPDAHARSTVETRIDPLAIDLVTLAQPNETPGPTIDHSNERQPPPTAHAAPVLTQAKQDAPPIVTDTQPAYVGGTTQETATSTIPIDDRNARVEGPSGGKGGAVSGSGEKRERERPRELLRPARLGGPKHWTCPFPREATIDNAWVRAEADVRADGSPIRIRILDDDFGQGFAREAIPCAMRETYIQAIDLRGQTIPATTIPFRVIFSR